MLVINTNRTKDVELMNRVARGDEAAVAELYDRFLPLVYRMARQALTNRSDLEDVVQGVFVLLWRTAGRYDATRASLVTWVMLITRRRIVDALRQHRRVQERSLDLVACPASDPDPVTDSDDRFARVVERMSVLSELQRTVLTRAYLRGQTLRQIGEDLHTPLGTIKTALSRGMNILRAEFAGDHQPDVGMRAA